MWNVAEMFGLQYGLVAAWHRGPEEFPDGGITATICQQHLFNYRLWHEEDLARCPDASDSEIAGVKRRIDRLNQQRNDWIERIDDELARWLADHRITSGSGARLNTETPGSAMDRLSILALRIYHLEEQLLRTDCPPEHIESVRAKLRICACQRDDLIDAASELLDGIVTGAVRHRTYRQLKMYNDPSLNPRLYGAAARRAAA